VGVIWQSIYDLAGVSNYHFRRMFDLKAISIFVALVVNQHHLCMAVSLYPAYLQRTEHTAIYTYIMLSPVPSYVAFVVAGFRHRCLVRQEELPDLSHQLMVEVLREMLD
jgi:hypothetical protein